MNKLLTATIIIATIIITIISYNGYLTLSTVFGPPSTIHVVISPIVNDSNYPKGSYVVYYDDYFNTPTSYWKKGFGITNDTGAAADWAIDKANFVSSPVVIVAPKWFEPYFVNVTNAEKEPVGYQWYG